MSDERQIKKVLAIAPYAYLPFSSGGQKFTARFFEHLSSKTELSVISVPGNDASLAGSYRLLPLLKPSFSRYADRSLVRTVTELVKKEGFETLVCSHPYFAWLLFAVKKRTGINTAILTHNIEYQRFRSMGNWWWPVLKGYEKRSFRKADRIFFITAEDRAFAIKHWHIAPEKCSEVPFGIDNTAFPTDRAESRALIAAKHGISPEEKIFSFNGMLDYKPNREALERLLHQVNPLLLQSGLKYKLLISGKNLPLPYNDLKEYTDKNIIYTGFVDNIAVYLKATDIFLNPVQSGGGIKTKLVEAIGYGATVVSSSTGAIGIDTNSCGPKLVVVNDNDWTGFVNAIQTESSSPFHPTPSAYYQYYSWENIIDRVAHFM